MLLNELIQNETIDAVATRTNLAKEVILRLVDRNFKALRKPQALGAITIIEREYAVDLSALRKECDEYYASLKPRKEDQSEILRPIAREKRSYAKPISFLLLLLLAGGSWYFFTNYYEKKVEPMKAQGEKPLFEQNDSGSEAIAPEENVTLLKEMIIVEEHVDTEQNTSGESRTNEKLPEADAIEENRSVEAAADQASSRQSNEREISEIPAVDLPERESIAILPQGKIWFRVTDYETKKSQTFKREERYDIDLRDHPWLFATEDSNFSIIDKDTLEEYRAEGKLFLRFDQKGVHELSEKEYRDLVK